VTGTSVVDRTYTFSPRGQPSDYGPQPMMARSPFQDGSYSHIKPRIWWLIILHAFPAPCLSHGTQWMCAVQATRVASSPPSGALLFTDFNNHEKSVSYKADNHTSGKNFIFSCGKKWQHSNDYNWRQSGKRGTVTNRNNNCTEEQQNISIRTS